MLKTNNTTPRTMSHPAQQLGLLAAILALGAGCGTPRHSPVRAPLPPAPWRSPSTYSGGEMALRDEHLRAIRQAIAEYEQATNALDQARQAEGVVRIAGEALQLSGWTPGQRFQIQKQRVAMLKTRDSAIARDCSERARPYIHGRQDYDKAIEALDDMIGLCKHFSAAEYWSETEHRQWLGQAKLLEDLRGNLVGGFADATATVKAALVAAQKKFVNSQAVRDLRAVRALYDAQDDKWFNWSILGHIRDDAREFAKAVQLCDRVLADPRIDTASNLAAATQRARSAPRLGAEGREIYNACSRLPGYSQCPGFPSLSPEELHRQSEILWRNQAITPVQPPDGCSDLPNQHLLSKQ
jgi:hypothetical protein